MNDLSILDNVQIETDENGNQHFTIIEQLKQSNNIDNRSLWQKVYDWWNNSCVKPYAKIRDLSDPFADKHYDGGTHKAAEAGIKISF